MSNAEQGPREWRFYVNDMLEFGEKVLSYTEGVQGVRDLAVKKVPALQK